MLKSIRKFLKNTSGSILPTFAVMTVPVFIIIGAAIDYSSYSQMRSEVHAALDAAALAATKELNVVRSSFPPEVDTPEEEKAYVEQQLETFTNNYMRANVDAVIPDSAFEVDITYIPPVGNEAPGLDLRADITYDTIFGFPGDSEIEILSIDKISEELQSLVILGNRTVEIALVLDNSGSMSGNRIDTLIVEAKKLVNNIHDADGNSARTDDPVKFSIIPFSGMVNVGTTHINASWMDVNGWSPSHHENFDWDTFQVTTNDDFSADDSFPSNPARGPVGNGYQINGRWMTRHDVFNMLGESWGGCVEMRPYPHNVLDTVVDNSLGQTTLRNMNTGDFADVAAVPSHNSNGNDHGGLAALFTPTFAPDEPDIDYYTTSGGPFQGFNIGEVFYVNTYVDDFVDEDGNRFRLGSTKANNILGNNNVNDFTGGNDQVKRTNWMFKYQNHVKKNFWGYTTFNPSNNSAFGPNSTCTTLPITPLTTDKQDAIDAIDALTARGSTNIQQGLTWGWRTLSPGEPFTEGRPKDTENNLKFIVALTDGNNFYQADFNGWDTPNRSGYGAWGYAREQNRLANPVTGDDSHNRWLDGLKTSDLAGTIYASRTFGGGSNQFDNTPESNNDFENIMNAHTAQACENIKDDGVSIYTIAFEVPSSGGVRDLLEGCAGSGRILVAEGTPDERLADISPTGTFYHDVDDNELDDAFASIASEIAALRLSR